MAKVLLGLEGAVAVAQQHAHRVCQLYWRTTMSGLPSPLISPNATEFGAEPGGEGLLSAGKLGAFCWVSRFPARSRILPLSTRFKPRVPLPVMPLIVTV